jgi:hypothetical protein
MESLSSLVWTGTRPNPRGKRGGSSRAHRGSQRLGGLRNRSRRCAGSQVRAQIVHARIGDGGSPRVAFRL